MCVITSRIVTRSLPYFRNSGMNVATGSVNRRRPLSMSVIAAVVLSLLRLGRRREERVYADRA